MILALAVYIETAIAALEALLEKTLEKFSAVMAHSRLGVRVNDKCMRDFNPASHLLLNPKGTTGADGRSAVLLNIRTGATARQTVGDALQHNIKDLHLKM